MTILKVHLCCDQWFKKFAVESRLLEEGLDEDLGKLLKQYPEDIAADWRYTWALWVFRQKVASPKANKLLKEALDYNPFAPLYLLGRKKIPSHLPDYVGLGDEREAVAYAAEAIKGWQKTPGAFEWLANNLLREVK